MGWTPQEEKKTDHREKSGEPPVIEKVTDGVTAGGRTTGGDRNCRSTKPTPRRSKKSNNRTKIWEKPNPRTINQRRQDLSIDQVHTLPEQEIHQSHKKLKKTQKPRPKSHRARHRRPVLEPLRLPEAWDPARLRLVSDYHSEALNTSLRSHTVARSRGRERERENKNKPKMVSPLK